MNIKTRATYYLLAIIMILTNTSCAATFFMSDSNKISGEWIYTQVKYTPNFSFKSIDKTADFYAYSFLFNSDHTVTYYNSDLQHSYLGYWQIKPMQNHTNDEQNNTHKMLEIKLQSQHQGLNDTLIVFEKLSLSNTKIYGTNYTNKKHYTMRLKKVTN